MLFFQTLRGYNLGVLGETNMNVHSPKIIIITTLTVVTESQFCKGDERKMLVNKNFLQKRARSLYSTYGTSLSMKVSGKSNERFLGKVLHTNV